MAGPPQADELAILVASFVDEVQSSFDTIRAGVTSLFAPARDSATIAAARDQLSTIAAAAPLLNLPAARQAGELAQLVDEAFVAALPGTLPATSAAPFLALVADLEAQLDGLLTGDTRGPERLDRAHQRLEQIERSVVMDALATPPTLEIDLEDLLLTLEPAPPTAPVETVASAEPSLAPPPAAPAPTGVVLVPEEQVAPIEWGAKEAAVWEQGGWDERRSAYGNTHWLFLDPAPDDAALATPESPSGPWAAPAERGGGAALSAGDLEEAALLSLSERELDELARREEPDRLPVLAARRGELTRFAAALGFALPAGDAAPGAIPDAGEADAELVAPEPASSGALAAPPMTALPAAPDDEEAEPSFLDTLLAEPNETNYDAARAATAEFFLTDEDEEAGATGATALPELAPEVAAAFATLDDAAMRTFLALEGEAARAFLERRLRGESAPPDPTHAVGALVEAASAPTEAAEPAPASLDSELLAVFLTELRDLLGGWAAARARLRAAPADRVALGDLRAAAHTVRGAASMVGFPAMGELARLVEELLDTLLTRGLPAIPPVLDFTEQVFLLLQRLSATPKDATAALPGDLADLVTRQARLIDELGVAWPDAPEQPPAESTPTVFTGELPPTPEESAPAIDDELAAIFVAEATEHVGNLNRCLVALDHDPGDAAQLAEARRLVHTLKGAANALGYRVTGDLCHALEDLFATESAERASLSTELLSLCFDAVEALQGLVAGIAAGQGEDADLVATLRQRLASAAPAGAAGGGGASGSATAAVPEPAEASPPAGSARGATARSVRVNIARLDDLLNLVGELVTNRTDQEQRLRRLTRAMQELRFGVEHLRRVGAALEARADVVAPVHGPWRAFRGDAEFDTLELDRYGESDQRLRELLEVTADLSAATGELEAFSGEFDRALDQQWRLATELQDHLLAVRLVPLATIVPRLYGAVRNVAERRDRDVALVVEGERTAIDKVLLEELTDPLLHLVRNAADHGIESPDARQARGKPARGTIRVSATREGHEAIIQVSDDGGGIDAEAVVARALACGVLRSRDEVTAETALDLIFQPGLSTSQTVSDVSGRGVGLDVVRTNVARARGTIEVASVPGVGTTFTLRFPILLTVMHALLVRVADQTFAIPLPVLEQVTFYRRELIRTEAGADTLVLGDTAYPVVSLAQALGLPPSPVAGPTARALLVGSAGRRVALVVDELVGQHEIVVKRLGSYLHVVRGITGATILGNGQVVLILNVPDLLSGVRREPHAVALGAPPTAAPAEAGERLALIVDDSLSIRRALTGTLERAGWTVLQAKDGVEAMEILSWARPRVLIVDIEMPRMDGYELTTRVRNAVEHHAMPIVMLTSRAGEKHRRKAFELGVSTYLVKPCDEAELLTTLQDLTGVPARETATRA